MSDTKDIKTAWDELKETFETWTKDGTTEELLFLAHQAYVFSETCSKFLAGTGQVVAADVKSDIEVA